MNIKEVEKMVGMHSKNIRFYEEEGLLEIPRNKENGYREFNDDCILALQEIKMFRGLGISLEDIRKYQHHEISVKQMMDHRLKEIEETTDQTAHMKELCKKMRDSDVPLVPFMVEECNQQMQNQSLHKVIPKMGKKQMKVRILWACWPLGFIVWMISSTIVFPKLSQVLSSLSIISEETAQAMTSANPFVFVISLFFGIFAGVLLNLIYAANRQKFFVLAETGMYYIHEQNKISKWKLAWVMLTKRGLDIFDYVSYEEIYSVEPGLRVVGSVGVSGSKVFERVFRIGTTKDEYVVLSCGTIGQAESGIALLSDTLTHYAKVIKDPYRLMEAHKLSNDQYYLYLNKVFNQRVLQNQERKENNSLWDFL